MKRTSTSGNGGEVLEVLRADDAGADHVRRRRDRSRASCALSVRDEVVEAVAERVEHVTVDSRRARPRARPAGQRRGCRAPASLPDPTATWSVSSCVIVAVLDVDELHPVAETLERADGIRSADLAPSRCRPRARPRASSWSANTSNAGRPPMSANSHQWLWYPTWMPWSAATPARALSMAAIHCDTLERVPHDPVAPLGSITVVTPTVCAAARIARNIAIEQRRMCRRGPQSVLGQEVGVLRCAVDEAVELDGTEADPGNARERGVEVLGDRVANGVELDGQGRDGHGRLQDY